MLGVAHMPIHGGSSLVINVASGVLSVVIVGVLAALWKWLKTHIATPLSDVPDLKAKQHEIHGKITNIEGRVEKIELEFQPNHGSSMKDSLNRIEERLRNGPS